MLGKIFFQNRIFRRAKNRREGYGSSAIPRYNFDWKIEIFEKIARGKNRFSKKIFSWVAVVANVFSVSNSVDWCNFREFYRVKRFILRCLGFWENPGQGVERSGCARYKFNWKITIFRKNRGGEISIFFLEFSGGSGDAGCVVGMMQHRLRDFEQIL